MTWTFIQGAVGPRPEVGSAVLHDQYSCPLLPLLATRWPIDWLAATLGP